MDPKPSLDLATVLTSAVVAALVSGCIAWFNEWRKRVSEETQKKADRKHAWRREVYMDALDAVQGLVVRMAHARENFDAEASLEDVRRFLAALEKVWLVAERPASNLSRDLVDEAMASFAMSAERVVELHRARSTASGELAAGMASLDYAQQMVEGNRALQTTLARLVAALRTELEIEGVDEEAMVQRAALSVERAKGTLNRLRETMMRAMDPRA